MIKPFVIKPFVIKPFMIKPLMIKPFMILQIFLEKKQKLCFFHHQTQVAQVYGVHGLNACAIVSWITLVHEFGDGHQSIIP